MDQHAPETLDLREYLQVVQRRKWTIIQTLAIVVFVALAVTFLQTPLYESSARVVVQQTGTSTSADAVLQQAIFGQQELETQKELVTSVPVAERVITALALEGVTTEELAKVVSVRLVRDTQILEITATSPDPADAAALAQGFADAYLDYRRGEALQRALAAAGAAQNLADQTQKRLDEIERSLRTATDEEAERLNREREALLNDLARLSSQEAALRATQTVTSGGGQIISPARIASGQSSPRPARTGALAIVLGLMLGVGLAFLRDFMDDTIRSEEQAHRLTGKPILGRIPRWEEARPGDHRLVSIVAPTSPVAEAYRTLRTNVRFLNVGAGVSSILVTSSLEDEGKTTTAANLAVAFARGGLRVLLVGADLRRPAMHKSFGLESSPGLSDVLASSVDILDSIVDVGIPNLRVVPSGLVPPNPSELLSSVRMTRLMSELQQLADLVIYDAPPLLVVADALELAPRTDAVVLVVDVGRTGRHALSAGAERLAGVGVQSSGLVLNNLSDGDGYGNYSYYGSYTAHPTAPVRR